MKKKMIIITAFIPVMNVCAQSTKNDSLKSYSNFKKNEISINTAPVLRQLLNNGEAAATRFSLTYKYNLNVRSALRLSLVADLINNDLYNRNFPGKNVILLNSDSVLIRQETISPSFVSPHLNLGYERLFGKKKLKWFYGADLTFGYSESMTFTQNIILQENPASSIGYVDGPFRPEIISRIKTKTFSVGVSPFFGAKYPVSKRFSISAQVGVDAVFRDQHVSETGNGQHGPEHVSTFDFNQDTGFLNDISIIYKF